LFGEEPEKTEPEKNEISGVVDSGRSAGAGAPLAELVMGGGWRVAG
jgi:hypothetical protein